MRSLIKEHNVQVKSYPDDVMLALAKASHEVVAEVGARDADSKKVYDSWKAYRDSAMEYSVLVDLPMMRARQIAHQAGF
jgi:TRAP-type mannitol/chloroaromatic compound transport system substrate-binding protein